MEELTRDEIAIINTRKLLRTIKSKVLSEQPLTPNEGKLYEIAKEDYKAYYKLFYRYFKNGVYEGREIRQDLFFKGIRNIN